MGRKAINPEHRAAAVVLLEKGKSNAEIVKLTGFSFCYIRNLREKFEGGEHLGNRKGQGRHRLSDSAEDRYLVGLSKKNRTKSSKELALEWGATIGKPVNSSTVRRRLLENNMRGVTQKRRPFRNELQKKKRYDWCKKYSGWPLSKWRRVVFSDESHFEVINRKNRVFVRRLPTEKDQPFNFQLRAQGGGGSVGVWGAFSYNGVGPLTFYEGRLNADAYINTISEPLLPYLDETFGRDRDDWWFMQDNAPCHKAKKALKWFEDHNIPLLDWPPTSPDVNPIENIWKDIDHGLTKYRITNVAELRQAITDIWNNYPLERCIKLVDSVPKRVSRVLKAKGDNISKY